MKYLRYFFHLVGPILGSYSWIRRYSKHPERYPLAERYAKTQALLRKVFKVFRIEVHVEGLERLPQGEDKYFIAPNHQSFMDPLLCISILDDPISFVAKKESKKYPFVGRIITSLNGLFMDRDNLRQELKTIRLVEKSLIANEESWVVFPEGKRSHHEDFEMNEFRPGTFKIPLDSQRTIVPVAIYGTFRPLSTKYKNKINPIQITILPPIAYEEFSDLKTIALSQKVEDIVREEMHRLRDNDAVLMAEIASRKQRRKEEKKKAKAAKKAAKRA